MNLVAALSLSALSFVCAVPLPASDSLIESAAGTPPPTFTQPRESEVPAQQIVREQILPQLDYLFRQLLAEGKDTTIDGTRAFNGRDPFLAGKIAIGMSDLLLNTPRSDPRFTEYLAGFRKIAAMTVDDEMHTWGIYYYVYAIYQLNEAGLLGQAMDPDTLARLRAKLDWRTFVRSDYTVIDLPTNYYHVAFIIARLRHLLGWEEKTPSEVLLGKMIHHYRTYSGETAFSDETDGEGRFDRYSVLLIAEICHRFRETGLDVTPQLKEWLRHAVDVVLVRLNPEGEGFQYGRSIGPYGDSAFLEILSAAAWLGVLSPDEMEMAYAFHCRAVARYSEFWYDSGMHSLNLWEHGRRTDGYRGKHRILGENFSLIHHYIYTSALWARLGFSKPAPTGEFVRRLRELPRFRFTWFARGEYDRGLLAFRDGLRVISLPLINGGMTKHAENPYFPIPFSAGLLQGVADATFPQLLPRFTLADGSQLSPTAFFRDMKVEQRGSAVVVTYRQSELNRLGKTSPVQDARMSVETTYVLDSGVITRTDRFTPTQPLQGVRIEMEFAGFSTGPVVEPGRVLFERGGVYEFSASGFATWRVDDVSADAEYRASTGSMLSRVRCGTVDATLDQPFTLSWTLRHR